MAHAGRGGTCGCEMRCGLDGLAEEDLVQGTANSVENRGRAGETCVTKIDVGLTDQTLSCAARACVPKPTRRSARTHVSRATQAARRRSVFDFTRRLGRRTEAGPRQLLWRVRPPLRNFPKCLLD